MYSLLKFRNTTFKIDGPDWMKTHLYNIDGKYDTHVMNVIDLAVPADSICLDLGANIGLVSLALSAASPDGKVYSFEPVDLAYNYLVNNISLNERTNLEAFNRAVFDHNKVVQFWDEGLCGGASHIYQEQRPYASNKAVLSIRLDDWIKNNKIQTLDFIKMDIEGAEIRAIQGGMNTFTKFRPDLVIEFNANALENQFGHNPKELYDLLNNIYKQIHLIMPTDSQVVAIDNYEQMLEIMEHNKGHYNVNYCQAELFCSMKKW